VGVGGLTAWGSVPRIRLMSGRIESDPNFLKFTDMPVAFMEETGFMLADYSVALGCCENQDKQKTQIYGSGVLVRKGNRLGVLTACHCADELEVGNLDGTSVVLVIKPSYCVIIPPALVVKHVLGKPNKNSMEPDLAFLEIRPSPILGSIKAVASFWNLDQKAFEDAKQYQTAGTPLVVIGFPGVYHNTKIEGRHMRKQVKHMTYFYAICQDSIRERGGWDYVEANNRYGQGNDLPQTFHGVSGGPVWGLQIKKDKTTGKLSVKQFALVGIAFLQIRRSSRTVRLRAHFIKSLYSRAWQGFSPNEAQ
jgi:hypothetical protein